MMPLLQQPAAIERPPAVKPAPPRYKTSLLSWAIVCSISTPIGLLLTPLRAYTPKTLHGPITSAAVIVVLNYAILPVVTQTPVCRRWLYPNRRQSGQSR